MPVRIKLSQSSPTAMKLDHPLYDIKIDRPTDQGGGGSGLMGGQFLLLEISIKGLSIELEAILSTEAPKRFTDVRLEVKKEFCSSPDEFQKLLKIAEKGCISVNTIKQGVVVNVDSN